MPDYALLVVDVQNDYFPGGRWTLNEMDRVAANVARLIAAARRTGNPIVHIRHEFASADAPFFTPGSDGAKIHAQALPHAAETVVLKHQVNSFRETDLKAILDRAEIKNVAICGAMSHMCVDAATRAAADFGYACTVIHDACASRDLEFEGTTVPAKQVHAAFMAALKFGYAAVQSTEEFLGKQPLKQ